MKIYRIYFLLLLFITNLSLAQETFYKSINPFPGILDSDHGTNIVESDRGNIIITTNSSCHNHPEKCQFIVQLDNQGNYLNTIFENNQGPNKRVKGLLYDNGDYYLLNNNFDTIYDNQITLKIYDSNLNLKHKNEYGGTESEFGHQITKGRNNNYLICGSQRDLITNYIDLHLIEVNANGKLIRSKTIIDSFVISDAGNIVLTEDGGYLIGHNIKKTAGFEYNGTKYCLTKLDKDWDIEWQKVFLGGPKSLYSPRLIKSPDSTYVMSWFVDSTIIINDRRLSFWPYFSKIDQHGDEIWRLDLKRYRYGLENIEITQNGDIIGCGYDGTKKNSVLSMWLFRISKDGDLLWEKRYQDTTNRKDFPLTLFDVIELKDGRIAATGMSVDSFPGRGMTDLNIGLLVVDKNGCIDPGCTKQEVLLSLQQNHYLSPLEYKLYPNPSEGPIKIELKKDIVDLRIEIHSLDGLVVYKRQLNNHQNDIYLTTKLNAGSYIIKLIGTRNGEIGIKKLIIY